MSREAFQNLGYEGIDEIFIRGLNCGENFKMSFFVRILTILKRCNSYNVVRGQLHSEILIHALSF